MCGLVGSGTHWCDSDMCGPVGSGDHIYLQFGVTVTCVDQWAVVPIFTCSLVQCCGSESEIIRMFWLDPNPNPNKKFGFGFRHCCRMKIFVKKSKIKHLKEKNLMFFY
jgi:hypothetical protein